MKQGPERLQIGRSPSLKTEQHKESVRNGQWCYRGEIRFARGANPLMPSFYSKRRNAYRHESVVGDGAKYVDGLA